MKKVLRIILISVVITIVVTFVITTIQTARGVFAGTMYMSEPVDHDEIPYEYYEPYGFDYDAFVKKHQVETFTLTSTYDGHDIPVDYIYAEGASDKDQNTVILAHGLGSNRKMVYPVAEVFLDNGYNVLAFDQRSQGENQAKYTTFGFLDKYDLKDCADYVREQSTDKKLGLFGTSYGGLTTILAAFDNELGVSEHTDFVVLDCPISNMKEEITYIMNTNEDIKKIPLPVGYMVWAGGLAYRAKFGFSYADVDGRKAMEDSTKADFPILIFNSGKDDMTPPNMGKDLAASFKGEGKHLVVFDDCGHMDGLKKHPDEYKEAVKDLLDEVK